jgi:hypothetical protein
LKKERQDSLELVNKALPLSGENGSRTDAAKILQGCYLYFHRERDIWMRSGKATGGQPFEDRLGQHDKGAKLRDEISLESNFYSHYPSNEAQINTSTIRLTKHDEGSLFKWSSNSLKRLKAKWNGDKEQRKRVHMVWYLVELVFDLSIARDNKILVALALVALSCFALILS